MFRKKKSSRATASFVTNLEQICENDTATTTNENVCVQLEEALSKPRGGKAMLKKLYGLREELVLHVSEDTMRRMFWEQHVMTSAEGRKLAAHCFLQFSTNASFKSLLVAIVKKEHVTSEHLQGIGETLCLAYKQSVIEENKKYSKDEKQGRREKLETIGMLWYFIFEMALVSRDFDEKFNEITKIFDNIDRSPFHDLLSEVLNSVLTPLARCFNQKVRLGTMEMMFRFYPVFPMDQEQHLALLLHYLKDECVEIRSTALLRSCSWLEQYWSLIDTETIRPILACIIDELAFDVVPAVRANVYRGLRYLAPSAGAVNVLNHAMKCTVPHGINDKNEKVRLQCFKLLNNVRTHRYIRFYDVVETPLLLSRYSVETDKHVLAELATLLFNSFIPRNTSAANQIQRLHAAMKGAGRSGLTKFCSSIYALKLIELPQVVNLIHQIIIQVFVAWTNNAALGVDLSTLSLDDSLLNAIAVEDMNNKENEPNKPICLDSQSTEFANNLILFECAVLLWQSISDDLENDEKLAERTEKIMFKFFEKIYTNFEDSAMRTLVLSIGTLFRSKTFSKEMEKFARKTLNEINSDYDSSMLQCVLIFVWHFQPTELLAVVKSDLEAVATFGAEFQSPASKKQKLKDRTDPNKRLQRAIAVLKHITVSPKLSHIIAAEHSAFLHDANEALADKCTSIVDEWLSHELKSIDQDTAVGLVQTYVSLLQLFFETTILNTDNSKSLFFNYVQKLLQWALNSLSPIVEDVCDASDGEYAQFSSVLEIIKAVTVLQNIIIVLAQGIEDWGPSFNENEGEINGISAEEMCKNIFASFCVLTTKLVQKKGPVELLVHVLESTKQLCLLKNVYQQYETDIVLLITKLAIALPEWVANLAEYQIPDATIRSICTLYKNIFAESFLSNATKERISRLIIKLLIKDCINIIKEARYINDPRDKDFSIPQLVRIFVHRSAFRNQQLLKSLTTQFNFVISSNDSNAYLPEQLPFDDLIMRIGAEIQLSFLLNPRIITERARGPSSNAERLELSDEIMSLVRQQLHLLAMRQDEAENEAILQQVKDFIAYEEPLAFSAENSTMSQ